MIIYVNMNPPGMHQGPWSEPGHAAIDELMYYCLSPKRTAKYTKLHIKMFCDQKPGDRDEQYTPKQQQELKCRPLVRPRHDLDYSTDLGKLAGTCALYYVQMPA